MPVIFWFRRDLRLNDNAGLYHALKSGRKVMPVFIFDRNILDDLPQQDARVQFIHQTITGLRAELSRLGAGLTVLYDTPEQAFRKLIAEHAVTAVYTNRDYEPYATRRDGIIGDLVRQAGIAFHTFKDQVIFEKNEVVKENKTPYSIFTPYSRKWKDKLDSFYMKSYPIGKYADGFLKQQPHKIPTLKEMGFTGTAISFPSPALSPQKMKEYAANRNIPAADGTTHLGIHLRFGTISIRRLARLAQQYSETLLDELIWRDFFQMILAHFPSVVINAFKPQYDRIQWRYDEADFRRWCDGMTGYPIVDAGMRELNQTGMMHNRVRMITASFLVKHLLIDWRWGEAYFAGKLLDYDLAANNGNWQWAAGSGCDAAPYFRIFNPERQTKRFDPDLKYIHKWVPELNTPGYPEPMVNHEEARDRCLRIYKAALNNQ